MTEYQEQIVLFQKLMKLTLDNLRSRSIKFESIDPDFIIAMANRIQLEKDGTLFYDYDTRNDDRYRGWRRKIIERDGAVCQVCGNVEELAAHHKRSWKNYPQERYKIENGITLCKECHKQTLTYGRRISKKIEELCYETS
jgi:5-methylcytosine-specific restriction endonuclease McrA